MAVAVAASAAKTCTYCTLPLGGRPYRLAGDSERGPLLFCCQGCAWVFQILGGQGEGSEATLAAARLIAAVSAGMVVMIASWSRYLDALLSAGRPAVSSMPVQPAVGLEAFFSQVYEPLAAGAVFALLGWPILRGAAAGLRRGIVGLDALVALGVLAAYLGSLGASLRGAGATYYDTATMILLLVTLGRYVESAARVRAARGLRKLLSAPTQAEVLRDGVACTLPVDAVRLDDRVLVRPGATFPVDGIVLGGSGGVDEAALTGESRPVLKQRGDAVIAGAVSYDGAFEVRPTRVGDDTFVRRMEAAIEQARVSRAPVERLADRLAAVLTGVAVAVGVGTFVYWGLLRGEVMAGLLHALAVVLIACPCALGIATPLALRVGLAAAARRGILIREAAALEVLGQVGRLFLDKTGTLTTGRPRLVRIDVIPGSGVTADEALALAAGLGQRSEHPASRTLVEAAMTAAPVISPAQAAAIVSPALAAPASGATGAAVPADAALAGVSAPAAATVAGETTVAMARGTAGVDMLGGVASAWTSAARPAPAGVAMVDDVRIWRGLGVSGRDPSRGVALALGSARLMTQLGFSLPLDVLPDEQAGETSVYLGRGGRAVAAFRLVDTVRPSAVAASNRLGRLGVRLSVLSGDSAAAASMLGDELGIRDVQAGLTPGDKAALVAAAPRSRGLVAMLGDGINDGPALAAADVGMAMGTGTDLARTTAPVVLAGDDLAQAPWLLELARRVRRTVRGNLFWATFYNVLGISLAAAGLLQPVVAAGAMVASSLLVLGNSLRLGRQEGS